MTAKLDRKLVKELSGKLSTEFASLQVLHAAGKGIAEVGGLQYLPTLSKLDISKNSLHDSSSLADCVSLRWLNLSANHLTSLKPLSVLNQLQVLNVSHNRLAGKLDLEGLPALCALIANNNAITELKGFGEAAMLNTLVLKHNRISMLGKSLVRCTALAKLSIANNQLIDLGTSLATCSQLAELRVSHNQLSRLPDSLAQNSRLKIVEMGGNLVESTSAVEVLRKLPHLASCSFKGCPFTQDTQYQQQIQAMLPGLRILDGRKMVQTQSRQRASQSISAQPDANLDSHGLGSPNMLEPSNRTEASKRKSGPGHSMADDSRISKKTKKSILQPTRTTEDAPKDVLNLSGQSHEPILEAKSMAPKKLRKRGAEPSGCPGHGLDGLITPAAKATATLKDFQASPDIGEQSKVKQKREEALEHQEQQVLEKNKQQRPQNKQVEGKEKEAISDGRKNSKLNKVRQSEAKGLAVGASGFAIGEALQRGLLGTALQTEAPLAMGWD